MSVGLCGVVVCVAEYVCMGERKIEGGIVSKYFENTFWYNRRIGFTDAPPPPSLRICTPNFFSVQAYPKRDGS